MATMKKTLSLTKIIGGFKKPDTGRTVTIRDTAGSIISTATETPANSGNYECSYAAVQKYGYWYVDGVQKDAYSNNTPFWLGNYNQISASQADITFVTASIVSASQFNGGNFDGSTFDASTRVNSPIVGRSGDGDLQLTAWSDGSNVTIGETEVTSNLPVVAPTFEGSFIATGTPVFNVKAYGATGDGVTDDYVAISQSIAAITAAGGGTLYFPKGEYKTSAGFKITSNTNIKGDGRNNSKISSVNSGSGATFISGTFFAGTDVNNIVVEDIWLRGVSMDGAGSSGFYFNLNTGDNTAHIMMKNVLISDMAGGGVTINTPILCTFQNVKVLRFVGSGFNFYNGTSTNMYDCYAITGTEVGFKFSTMVYCALVGCASEVCGVGYDFDACSSITLVGCGSEAQLNRSSSYPGYGYRSNRSTVVLDSCYDRDPVSGVFYSGSFQVRNFRGMYSGSQTLTPMRVVGDSWFTGSMYVSSSLVVTGTAYVSNSLHINGDLQYDYPTFNIKDDTGADRVVFNPYEVNLYDTNGLAKFRADDIQTRIYDEAGNVAINIVDNDIDINDNTTVNGNLVVTGNLTAQQYIISSSVIYMTESFSSGSTRFGNSADDTHIFTGSIYNGNVIISSSGYVGIGTTSPTSTFHVSSSVIDTVTIDNSNAQYGLRINSSGKYIRMGALNSFYAHFKTDATNGFYFYEPVYLASGNNLLNNGTSYLVSATGNLGIGKTSPNAKLDVNGNTLITGSLTATGNTILGGTVSASGVITGNELNIYATQSSVADVGYYANGVVRWVLRRNTNAETGANAGSNFELIARNDAGAWLRTDMLINRATGAVTWGGGNHTGIGSLTVATASVTGDFTVNGNTTIGNSGTDTLLVNATMTASNGLSLNNSNITAVNALTFNDPGPQEGIIWGSGSGWSIYESPNDLATNSAGNLQFASGSTRVTTIQTDRTLNHNGNLLVTGSTYFYTNSNPSGAFMATIYNADGGGVDGSTLLVRGGGWGDNSKIFETQDYYGSSSLTVFGQGNVGIGLNSSTPVTKLHLSGSGVTFDRAGNFGQYIDLYRNGSRKWQLHGGITSGSDDFSLRNASSTSIITMLQGGAVGIGTTSPTYKLEVNSAASDDTAKFVTSRNIVTQAPILIYSNKTTNSGNGDRALIVWNHDKSDNSGVMAAAVGSRVFSAGSATGLGLDFSTGGTTSRMVIDNSGNVGIGKTTANARVDISGSLIVSGSTTITGDIIVSQSVSFQSASLREHHINASVSGNNPLFNATTGSYTSVFVRYTAASASNARAGTIQAVWNGSSIVWNELTTMDIGSTAAVSCSVTLPSGNVQVNFNTPTAGWQIKSIVDFM